MFNKIRMLGVISFIFIITVMLISNTGAFAQNESLNKNPKDSSKILSAINNYQKEYFSIIKRRDILFCMENNKYLNKDRKELSNLFKKVKKQVKNKHYLSKYNDIKNKYAKCNDVTDTGMIEFSESNFNAIDNLLNQVYKEIELQIPPEDFERLGESEIKWQKEAEEYENVFHSMEYGTIGKLIYYEYQINIREFRTLLLMLYL